MRLQNRLAISSSSQGFALEHSFHSSTQLGSGVGAGSWLHSTFCGQSQTWGFAVRDRTDKQTDRHMVSRLPGRYRQPAGQTDRNSIHKNRQTAKLTPFFSSKYRPLGQDMCQYRPDEHTWYFSQLFLSWNEPVWNNHVLHGTYHIIFGSIEWLNLKFIVTQSVLHYITYRLLDTCMLQKMRPKQRISEPTTSLQLIVTIVKFYQG